MIPTTAYKLAQRATLTKQVVHPSGNKAEGVSYQFRRNEPKPLSRRDRHRLDVKSRLGK